MKTIIKMLFRMAFLMVSVFLGFYFIKKLEKEGIEIKPQIEKIKGRIKRRLNELNNSNFIEDIQEDIYDNDEKPVKKISLAHKKSISLKLNPTIQNLNSRQKEIFEILKTKRTVEMKYLLSMIKNITERTLRRDLLRLQELKLISKEGNTKSVKYHLIAK